MKQFFDFTEKSINEFVELRGRKLLLAEGYSRILVYTPTEIRIAKDKEGIAVYGENLALKHLSERHIAVEGRIDSVEFI